MNGNINILSMKYRLYGLLDITIDDACAQVVKDAVDFQLNYFRVETLKGDTPYQINVFPYDNSSVITDSFDLINYTITGGWGKGFNDADNRFALLRNSAQEITIFNDNGGFLINQFIQYLLLADGFVFIHSAGIVNHENRSILFTGAGGVGKTAVLGEFVKTYKYKLLGDDILAIQSDGMTLPFPRSFIIKEYHQHIYPELFREIKSSKPPDWLMQLKAFIRLNAPFREVIREILIKKGIKEKIVSNWHIPSYIAAVPVEKIFGEGVISSGAKVSMVIDFIRYRGDSLKVVKTPAENILIRMNSIIQFEWNVAHLHNQYMGMFGISLFRDYVDTVYELSKRYLEKADCYTFYIPEKADPNELIEFVTGFVNEKV